MFWPYSYTSRKELLSCPQIGTVANCSLATENIPTMSGNPPSNPPSSGGTGSSGSGTGGSAGASSTPSNPPVSAAQIKTAAANTFVMPPGTHLEVLTGQNWNVWSGVLCAILQINEVDSLLNYEAAPSSVDKDDWSSVQKKSKAYLLRLGANRRE